MSSCTPEQLAELISVSRMVGLGTAAPLPSPEQRKAADNLFLSLCRDAVNAGDALFAVALNPAYATGIRLNAAFAVTPLLTTVCWTGAGHFQQQAAILEALQAYVTQGVPQDDKRLVDALTECLARIVVCEFPNARWFDYLASITTATRAAAVTGVPDAAQQCALRVLDALCSTASDNADLWLCLASDVAPTIVQGWSTDTSASAPRAQGIRCLLHVLRRRPKPSAMQAAEARRRQQFPHEQEGPYLLSDSVAVAAAQLLRACVSTTSPLWWSETGETTDHTASLALEECDGLLALLQRLIKRSDVAGEVFQSAATVIASARHVYADPSLSISAVAASAMENAMECLLNVLQVFPATAAAVPVDDLLGTLIYFMAPRSMEETGTSDVDVDQQVRTLSELITDDEIVPLGCGDGDIPSLAEAVLELYLEAFPERATAAVQVVTLFWTSLSVTGGAASLPVAAVAAAVRALRAVARVCVDADAALIESVPAEAAQGLHTVVLATLLALMNTSSDGPGTTRERRAMSSHVLAALALEAYSLCYVHLAKNVEACSGMAALLNSAYEFGHPVVQWVALFVAARLLTETDLDEKAAVYALLSLTSAAWLQRALSVMADTSEGGDHLLPLYCGGSAACAILGAPETLCQGIRQSVAADESIVALLSRALSALCTACQTRGAADLLKRMLRLCAVHRDEGGDGPDCRIALALEGPLSTVMAMIQRASADASLVARVDVVVRAVSDLALDLACDLCAGAACACCTTAMLRHRFLPILTEASRGHERAHLQGDSLLDDAASRSRCAAICVACVALKAVGEGRSDAPMDTISAGEVEYAFATVLRIAEGAAAQRLAVRTVSTCCAYVAAMSAAFPWLLRELVPLPSPNAGEVMESCVAANASLLSSVPSMGAADSPISHDGGFNFLGQWFLQCVQLVANPDWLTQVLSGEGSSHLPAAPRLFTVGCSLLPFADDVTAGYALAAFARLLSCTPHVLYQRLPEGCALFYAPSILAKTLPARDRIHSGTVADAVAFALVSARLRRSSTSKVKNVPEAVVQLIPVHKQYASLSQQSSPSQAPSLAIFASQLSPRERVERCCDELLAQLSSMGFDTTVASVTSFLAQKR